MPFLHRDPFVWLEHEIKEATRLSVPEPTAMQLATVSEDGWPEVRTVLFKGLVEGGLSFYTNYESPKAQSLLRSHRAALNFFWAPLNQQIRLRGEVKKLSREQSESYFRTRPRLSQLGAWASEQSSEIPDLDFLEKRVKELDAKYQAQEIPCPPHWGGFVLIPNAFEFWFGREGRLHERYVFKRNGSGWSQALLSP